MKRIVITGPTGAVGMALIHKCIAEKTEVLAICHKGSRRNVNVPVHPLVSVEELDLSELRGMKDALAERLQRGEFDVFYHLGWEGTLGELRDDMSLQVRNIQYTLDAVELAERLGCKAFVGAGSQAEYGGTEEILRPDTSACPETGYGMAKLCAGMMSRKLCAVKKITHIWVRILSVYGPYDGDQTMITSALRRMLNNEETSFTPGGQLWDYLYSADAAEALYLLGSKGVSGKVYCLGSGRERPLYEYIRMMQKKTGYHGDPGIGKLPYSPGQVMRLCADITELKKDIGFIPSTTFEKGIQETVEWMKENMTI